VVPLLIPSDIILPTTEVSSSQTSGIDNLTSGMKKIKLNLTTKAQREAKELEKQAAKPATKPITIKPAKPRQVEKAIGNTRIIPPAAQAASINNGPSSAVPQSQLPEILPPMPITPQHSLPAQFPAHLQQAAEVPLPTSSPAAPPYPTLEQGPEISRPAHPPSPSYPALEKGPQIWKPTSASASASTPSHPVTTSDVFIPYQPEGPPPESMIQQEPLKWLPPNTATPSPMKRGDLPVFTSTGAIPFGLPRVNGEVKKEENKGKDVDIWEVPETPKK
jgi:histone deacetylase HOS3